MASKELVDCFYDTIKLSNSIVASKTKKSIKTNKIYKENFTAENRKIKNEFYFDVYKTIYIQPDSSFNVAKNYLKYGKTAVLNFANPHNPGGGVQNGAMAQEECLCRSSNLYLCISNKNVFNDYYLYNRNIGNYFFSDRLIYTKNVTVFKDDSDVPKIMPENEWFNVDVITCAAPYIAKRKYTNLTALKLLFKNRVKNIFEAAIDNDVDVIILGAFGCGAFKNPPELVAKAFKEVIDENEYCKYFKKIVFAIKNNNSTNSNYSAFKDELCALGKQTKMKNQPLSLIELLRPKSLNFSNYFNYQNWKKNNKYYKKQFSIFGDSVSTLAGYNPKGYNVFYDYANCEKSGVKDMKDTWWGKVIDFFGGELLVNNSWSGSRVTRLPNSNTLFPSGCSDERTSSLHINSVKPDVIIVYLGFNDWANGVPIYSNKTRVFMFYDDYFSEAYEFMISKLKANYPKAEIWCCTLNMTYMSSNPSFSFPKEYRGIHIEKYNNEIKHLAKAYGCKVIDLYSHQEPYDSIDGSHPNIYGMNTLATLIIKEIGGAKIYKFLDNENINESKSDFCPYCGKEINLDDAFCVYCGKPLKDNPEFSICPNCHQQTLKRTENSYYCINCSYESSLIFDNKSMYVWDPSNMNIENMESFEISFGDYPIFNISYGDEKLNIYNTINYSRDGWMDIPDGFFIDETVNLTKRQKEDIVDFLKKIDFSNWKTDDNVIKNYEEGACGFCINNSLTVIFKNGKCFNCYEPKVKEFDQLVDFLKSFCDIRWFKPFYNKDDNGVKKINEFSRENHENDIDYVYLPPFMTKNLYNGTLKLYDLDTNKNIEIKKNKIDVGSNSDCDLQINSNDISQIHASFYHEDASWFIMDRNSVNGTWLNGVKLDSNKKYELDSEYIINFAGIKKYVFYKTDIKYDGNKKSEIKAGTIINDKYELLKQIGQSTTAVVYFAIDKRINKQWAIKISKNDSPNCEGNKNILLKELETLNQLDHPAIPKIIDVIDTNDYFAIVMDYIEGESLDSIVNNFGKQNVMQIIDWSLQLCDVLGYLHSLNPPRIYRDMKPANIILKPNGKISLIDFGIMRTYKPNKKADTVSLGTVGFAAPEQFGTAQTDCRSDIYALGMTMFNLYSGIRPDKNINITLCNEHDTLIKDFISVVKKCTELNPNDRYQSCSELKEDLISLKKNKHLKKRLKIFN